MKRVLMLVGNDWEGLYIDGNLIEEGHSVNRMIIFTKSVEYNYTPDDYREIYSNEICNYLEEHGGFPKNITELKFLQVEDFLD